jgi:hypothetical protein
MSDPTPFSDPHQNAYLPPQYVAPKTQRPTFDPARVHELSARVRTFRGYCSALAVVLCIWGTFSLVIAVVAATAVANSAEPDVRASIALGSLAFNAVATFTFGIALFFRQVWAAWGVLVYTGLLLAGNLFNMNLNVCLFVLVAIFTSTSVTIIVQAAKLRADGVSPQAKLVRGVLAS